MAESRGDCCGGDGGGQTALAWSPSPWEFEFDQEQENTDVDKASERGEADDAQTPGKYRLLRAKESFLDETRYSYLENKDSAAAYERLGAYGYLNDNEEVMFWRAWYASKAGMVAEAEGLYRALIAKDPENPWNYNALGYLLATDKPERLSDAAELLEKAWEVAPNEPAIIHSLGYVFQQGLQLKMAKSHYDKALQLLGNKYEEDLYLHYAIFLALNEEWNFEWWLDEIRGVRGGDDALYLRSAAEFNERLEEKRQHTSDISDKNFIRVRDLAHRIIEKNQDAEDAASNETNSQP